MSDWPPAEIFPDRSRPHRLPWCEYQKVLQPVFFAACTKDRRPIMLQRGLPGAIELLLDGWAERHCCAVIAHTIMPDHVHVLACVLAEGGDVLSFFKEFKRAATLAAQRRGFETLWQRDFWDRHTRNERDLYRCISYILQNPVEEGLCAAPEDWRYAAFRGLPWDLARAHDD